MIVFAQITRYPACVDDGGEEVDQLDSFDTAPGQVSE